MSKPLKKRSQFECTICKKQLSSEAHFTKHMNTIHKPKQFICDFDGKIFNTKDSLRLHMFNHRIYYKIKCEVCSKEYKTDQSMRKHLRTHFQQHQCDLCGQIFKYRRLLQNHINAIHEEALTVQCKYCTRLFANTTTRDSHQQLLHKDQKENQKIFKCTECAAGFEMKEELRIHSFIHYNGTIHTCLDCNQIFKKKKLLNIHMQKHEMTNFVCTGCDQSFKYKSNLNKHLKKGRCKVKNEEDESDKLNQEVAEIARQQLINITKDYSRSVVVPTKDEEQKKKIALQTPKINKNEVITHPEEEIDDPEILKSPTEDTSQSIDTTKRIYIKKKTTRVIKPHTTAQYECDICGLTFQIKCKLLSHIRLHISSVRHKCKICEQTFKSMKNLHTHSMKIHGRGAYGTVEYSKFSFECEICKKLFSAERIKAHMALHTTPKIICDHCGKFYRTKTALEYHLSISHKEEKKFTCSVCGKSFKKMSILKQHEETHNPIKIFIKCEMCPKILQMKHLKLHMDIQHGNKYNERNHHCHCGKAFRYEKQLDKHKEQVHEAKNRGAIYPCTECDKTFTRRQELRNHSFIHYNGPVFQCTTCQLKFKKKKLLYIHSRVHNVATTKYPCGYCQIIFKTCGGRRKHQLKVHKNDKGVEGTFEMSEMYTVV
ncbi:unnamed protein product [Chironomus riparius]|uniref:C2H2-type domain-containing protein n=1 Tax=Chironomus riparius TaxID=315576 RepID=A0A9N9RRC9_9DIPT|nr:unnamed protein product [Chironomus riparius]